MLLSSAARDLALRIHCLKQASKAFSACSAETVSQIFTVFLCVFGFKVVVTRSTVCAVSGVWKSSSVVRHVLKQEDLHSSVSNLKPG